MPWLRSCDGRLCFLLECFFNQTPRVCEGPVAKFLDKVQFISLADRLVGVAESFCRLIATACTYHLAREGPPLLVFNHV